MEVKIYSIPTCPYCKMTKEYLRSKDISFVEYDVSQDQAALEDMVKASGQTAVPVIVINQEVIVGFDRRRIDSLLVR